MAVATMPRQTRGDAYRARMVRDRAPITGPRGMTDKVRARAQNSVFGRYVTECMDTKDLDVPALCGLTGMGHATIYNMLGAADPTPDYPTLLKLAKALETPVINIMACVRLFDTPSMLRLSDDLDPRVLELLAEDDALRERLGKPLPTLS